jgi:Domain of unknown function (DUF4267)
MRTLTFRSPLYWLTLAVAVGIIFIGGRFLLAPEIAARGFGIPLEARQDVAFLLVKGVRDVVSGMLFLALVWIGDRRLIGTLLLIATLIPVSDGAIVLSSVGWKPVLAIHWGTALYMLLLSLMLLRRSSKVNQDWADIPIAA